MKKWMTKKNVLIGSGVLSVTILILNQIGTDRLCSGRQYQECIDFAYVTLILLLPVLPLFLLSLITYNLREEIYTAWSRFARWWIPLSMFLTLVAPSQSHDWMFPIDKGRVSFFMSLFFAIISLILIAYKFFTPKKGGAGK
jgi:hypothetical protein